MKISVFGLGYVGAVSCACLPELGHEVIGVDISPQKVKMINDGQSPVVEEGINELIENGKLAADLGLPQLNPLEDRVMLCGSPEMLASLKALLEHRDFDEGSTTRPATS